MRIFKDWTFHWWEIGLLKIGLISLGIILTIYFYGYLVDLTWLWWIIFIVTSLYFIVRWIRKEI